MKMETSVQSSQKMTVTSGSNRETVPHRMVVVYPRSKKPRGYQWGNWYFRATKTRWGHHLYFCLLPFLNPSIKLGESNRNSLGTGQYSSWLPTPRRNRELTCPEYQQLGLSTLLLIHFPLHLQRFKQPADTVFTTSNRYAFN